MRKLTNIKIEMIKKGVTSLELSKDLGINSCQFSLYLNGWREVPPSLKREIALYLEVEPSKLFNNCA